MRYPYPEGFILSVSAFSALLVPRTESGTLAGYGTHSSSAPSASDRQLHAQPQPTEEQQRDHHYCNQQQQQQNLRRQLHISTGPQGSSQLQDCLPRQQQHLQQECQLYLKRHFQDFLGIHKVPMHSTMKDTSSGCSNTSTSAHTSTSSSSSTSSSTRAGAPCSIPAWPSHATTISSRSRSPSVQQLLQQLRPEPPISCLPQAFHSSNSSSSSNRMPSSQARQQLLQLVRAGHPSGSPTQTAAFHTSSSSALANRRGGGWSSAPDPRHKRAKEQRKAVKYVARPDAGVPVANSLEAATAAAAAEGSKAAGRPKGVGDGKERFMRSLKIYTVGFMVVGVIFAAVTSLRGVIRSCCNMMRSKDPKLQQLAAERLYTIMYTEALADQMVDEGCAEGLIDLLKEESNSDVIIAAMKTIEYMLQYDVPRSALLKAGLLQRLRSGLRAGWLPAGLVGRVKLLVERLEEDEQLDARPGTPAVDSR